MIVNNERGLTLIEVLVALVILSMALVTMMNGFYLGGRQNADTHRYNVAITLAQSKMEEIKKKPFDDIVSVFTTNFSSEADYAQYPGFSYTVTVDNAGVVYKDCTVTVFYSDEGVAKTFALTTGVTKKWQPWSR